MCLVPKEAHTETETLMHEVMGSLSHHILCCLFKNHICLYLGRITVKSYDYVLLDMGLLFPFQVLTLLMDFFL